MKASLDVSRLLAEATALQQAGRLGEARACCERALKQAPGNLQARHALGVLHLQGGALEAGVAELLHVIKREPAHAEAHYNLGLAYARLGKQQKALASFQRVCALAPSNAEARFYLGLTLAGLQRFDEARACFEKVIGLAPGLAVAHLNLGNALAELGRHTEAVPAFEQAIALDPALAEAHNGLGAALARLNRFEDAAKCLRAAIRLNPELIEAYTGLSDVLRLLGQSENALSCVDEALRRHPDDALAHVVRGQALLKRGRYGEARAAFGRALALQPDCAAAHSELGAVLLLWGEQGQARSHGERAIALAPGNDVFLSGQLFNLHYHPHLAADELAGRHRLFDRRFGAPLRAARQAHANTPDPARRIRVGFVSGDFRRHPVGYFMVDLLEGLAGGGLDLYAYANHRLDDALTERIRPHFAGWRKVYPLDDETMAAQIRADGIDVLVDLSGHTGDNRLKVFARKPAPVQVSYLGYPDTTGLSAVDCILGDARMFPPGEDVLYAETPWHLPDTALCFSPPDVPVEVASLPAMQNGFVTFGCLNKTEKANNDAVIETWARILHAVPGSKLLLQNKPYGDAEIAASVRGAFEGRGIGADRLELLGALSWQAHLETFNRVDIALDPFPYNGTTTSVEGLWMGVPFVALKGDRLVAHMGESILFTMGMTDWVAADKDDYVAKATAFAGDLTALARIRAELRPRLLASPICDAPRFARNLETAFRGMWQAWCRGQG